MNDITWASENDTASEALRDVGAGAGFGRRKHSRLIADGAPPSNQPTLSGRGVSVWTSARDPTRPTNHRPGYPGTGRSAPPGCGVFALSPVPRTARGSNNGEGGNDPCKAATGDKLLWRSTVTIIGRPLCKSASNAAAGRADTHVGFGVPNCSEPTVSPASPGLQTILQGMAEKGRQPREGGPAATVTRQRVPWLCLRASRRPQDSSGPCRARGKARAGCLLDAQFVTAHQLFIAPFGSRRDRSRCSRSGRSYCPCRPPAGRRRGWRSGRRQPSARRARWECSRRISADRRE